VQVFESLVQFELRHDGVSPQLLPRSLRNARLKACTPVTAEIRAQSSCRASPHDYQYFVQFAPEGVQTAT
jgi:hypothetical protein